MCTCIYFIVLCRVHNTYLVHITYIGLHYVCCMHLEQKCDQRSENPHGSQLTGHSHSHSFSFQGRHRHIYFIHPPPFLCNLIVYPTRPYNPPPSPPPSLLQRLSRHRQHSLNRPAIPSNLPWTQRQQLTDG